MKISAHHFPPSLFPVFLIHTAGVRGGGQDVGGRPLNKCTKKVQYSEGVEGRDDDDDDAGVLLWKSLQ